jgi:hypothetical protein
MSLLFFKLTVTPLLLLAASVASRRWGEAIGGFLVGLPLTSGPVSIFLALEHGPAFAAQATSGSLAATAAQAAFCVAYCWLAEFGWALALAAACAIFAVAASLLQASGLSQAGLFVVAILALALALSVTPRHAVTSGNPDLPWWDLPARMALITALVVGVTLVAPYVGPGASGVLASIPFMAVILTTFAHRRVGHAAAQQVMRGMAAGLFGFAVFFFVLSVTLTRLGIVAAYASAILGALLAQALSLRHMRRPIAQLGE